MDIEERMRQKAEQRKKEEEEKRSKRVGRARGRNQVALVNVKEREEERRRLALIERDNIVQKRIDERVDINSQALEKRTDALAEYRKRVASSYKARRHAQQEKVQSFKKGGADGKTLDSDLKTVFNPSAAPDVAIERPSLPRTTATAARSSEVADTRDGDKTSNGVIRAVPARAPAAAAAAAAPAEPAKAAPAAEKKEDQSPPPAAAAAPAAAAPPAAAAAAPEPVKKPVFQPKPPPSTGGAGSGPGFVRRAPPTGMLKTIKRRIDRVSAGLTTATLTEEELAPDALGEVAVVNLSQNKIDAIPGVLGEFAIKTTDIDFSYNELNGSTQDDAEAGFGAFFRSASAVRKLNLAGNRSLKHLPLPPKDGEEPWKLASTLKDLDLTHIRLESLPAAATASTMRALEQLVVRHNHLASLPDDTFGDEGTVEAHLKTFNGSHNRLASLPPSLGLATTLTTLDVSWNKLTSLPEEIGKLEALVKLDASHNELTSLPDGLGTCYSLEVLDVSFNHELTALPTAIFPETEESGLGLLRELHLRSCAFAEIQAGVLYFGALETLDMTSNKLASLPDDISYLAALRNLLLCDNQLTALPDTIGAIEGLEVLNVAFNQITELPTTNYYLMRLYAGYNKLTCIPEMEGMEYLKEVHISGNTAITSLPLSLFAVTSLEIIYADCCSITEIPEDTSNLDELGVLNVAHNRLVAVPNSVFSLKSLRVLDLSHNDIKVLDPNLSCQELYELAALDISFNRSLDMTQLPDSFSTLHDRDCHILATGCRHCPPTNGSGGPGKMSYPTLRPYAAAEMCGRRDSMEDAMTLCDLDVPGIGKCSMFGVMDGHAGRAVAAVTAKRYPTVFLQLWKREKGENAPDAQKDVVVMKCMYAAFKIINKEIPDLMASFPRKERSAGSTTMAVLLSEEKVYLANLGDTRAVLARTGSDGELKAIRLSHDHKPSDEDEDDRIRKAGGWVTFRGQTARVNGTLGVARAVGDHFLHPFVVDDAYTTMAKWDGSKDCFLIIACDGVWDELTDKEAVTTVQATLNDARENEKSAGGDGAVTVSSLHSSVVALRDRAYLQNSDDNITAVVISLAN